MPIFAQFTISNTKEKHLAKIPILNGGNNYLIVSFSCSTLKYIIQNLLTCWSKQKYITNFFTSMYLRFMNLFFKKTSNRFEYNSYSFFFGGGFFCCCLYYSYFNGVLPTFSRIFVLQSACFSYKFFSATSSGKKMYHFYMNEMANKFGEEKRK